MGGREILGVSVDLDPYHGRSTWTWNGDYDVEICERDANDTEYLCERRASDDCDGVSQVYGGDGSSQSDPEVLARASWEAVGGILGRCAAISAIDGSKGWDAHVKGILMVQERHAMGDG